MEISAERVGVDGPHGTLLAPTSLRVAEGQLALVTGEPGAGHTALALALAGRMRYHHGVVLADGKRDDAALRRSVAVVDSAETTEPEGVLTVAEAVAEELAMASLPSGKTAVRRWLAAHDTAEHARTRVEHVPAEPRTRLLAELAVARPGVRALVFDSPDRHTTDAHTWWATALRHARNGLAVVVLCTGAAARQLPVPAARIGTDRQPAPLAIAHDLSLSEQS